MSLYTKKYYHISVLLPLFRVIECAKYTGPPGSFSATLWSLVFTILFFGIAFSAFYAIWEIGKVRKQQKRRRLGQSSFYLTIDIQKKKEQTYDTTTEESAKDISKSVTSKKTEEVKPKSEPKEIVEVSATTNDEEKTRF